MDYLNKNQGRVTTILVVILLIGSFLFVASKNGIEVSDIKEFISNPSGNIYKKFIRDNCNDPLKYSLGEIDERFGLDKKEIISILKEAENVWEKSLNKDLFEYVESDSNAVLVNFIFDERQARFFAAKVSEDNLEQKWDTYEQLIELHETIFKKHSLEVDKYDDQVSLYESKITDYEAKVDDWNKNGGTQEEYNQLKKEEKEIDFLYNLLNKERDTLNKTAEQLNQLSEEINSLYDQLDTETDIHNEEYASDDTITSGDYGNYEINIYQFVDRYDLRLTFAHEMGHALGVDHIKDPNSIMNFISDDQDVLNLIPSEKDIFAVKEVCNFE